MELMNTKEMKSLNINSLKTELLFVWMNSTPSANPDYIKNAATWVLQQASWVILAALVIMGITAWITKSTLQFFGAIVLGAILWMFASDTDQSLIKSLSGAIRTILGLP